MYPKHAPPHADRAVAGERQGLPITDVYSEPTGQGLMAKLRPILWRQKQVGSVS